MTYHIAFTFRLMLTLVLVCSLAAPQAALTVVSDSTLISSASNSVVTAVVVVTVVGASWGVSALSDSGDEVHMRRRLRLREDVAREASAANGSAWSISPDESERGLEQEGGDRRGPRLGPATK